MSRPNKWVGMAPQLCHRCATYIANYILNRPKRWSIKKTFSNSPEKYLLIKLFGKHKLHKMCVFERKNAKFTTALSFLGHLKKKCWFSAHLVCAKLLNRNIVCAKKNTFRKSECLLHLSKHFLYIPVHLIRHLIVHSEKELNWL